MLLLVGRDSKVQHNIECYKYLNSFSQREATSPSIDDRYVVGPCSINVMQVYISFLTEVLTFIVFVALEMCHVLGNAKSALSHLILATLPILPVKSKENLSNYLGPSLLSSRYRGQFTWFQDSFHYLAQCLFSFTWFFPHIYNFRSNLFCFWLFCFPIYRNLWSLNLVLFNESPFFPL